MIDTLFHGNDIIKLFPGCYEFITLERDEIKSNSDS